MLGLIASRYHSNLSDLDRRLLWLTVEGKGWLGEVKRLRIFLSVIYLVIWAKLFYRECDEVVRNGR